MKVLVGGQGADEALMGYRKFQLLLLGESMRQGDMVKALRLASGIVWRCKQSSAG